MSERVYLQEGESAELMRRSNGRHLLLGFGPGGVWLQSGATWEREVLAEIRKSAAASTVRCESCGGAKR